LDQLPEPKAVRAASMAALTRRFDGWDGGRAARRAALAADLLRALDSRASLEMREAMESAASVLDVGRSVGFFDRHEHAADVVLATDLEGFSHRGIALLSAVIRAAGGEEVKPKLYAPLLGREDRAPIHRAGVILALADDIEERCLAGGAIQLRCDLTRRAAKVAVPQLLGWRPRALDSRFEKAFSRRLLVSRG
jgi:exopolyphosphatase/guanosine-5'-triphosphate,3'-diphosphate pyrophosphatase